MATRGARNNILAGAFVLAALLLGGVGQFQAVGATLDGGAAPVHRALLARGRGHRAQGRIARAAGGSADRTGEEGRVRQDRRRIAQRSGCAGRDPRRHAHLRERRRLPPTAALGQRSAASTSPAWAHPADPHQGGRPRHRGRRGRQRPHRARPRSWPRPASAPTRRRSSGPPSIASRS